MELHILLAKFKPTDFQTKDHYWNTFGQAETETSAIWIVQFLQHRMTLGDVDQNGWSPFTVGELTAFYNDVRGKKGRPPEEFWFNRLVTDLASSPCTLEPASRFPPGPDAIVTVTEKFVERIISQLVKSQ